MIKEHQKTDTDALIDIWENANTLAHPFLPDAAFIGKGYGGAPVDHAFGLKWPLRVEVFRKNAVGRPFQERYGLALEEEASRQSSGSATCEMAMPTA